MTSAGAGYVAYQTKLRWDDALLEYQPTTDPADENLWPEACVPARKIDQDQNKVGKDTVLSGCASDPPQLSAFTGPIAQFEMRSQEEGVVDVILVPKTGDPQFGTHLVNELSNRVHPALVNAQITCRDSDKDDDGCTDVEELGSDERFGGRRDPNNFWDFFDTPVGTPPERDKAVTVGDIFGVVARFGTTGSTTSVAGALSTPPAAGYHAGFDRTLKPFVPATGQGGDLWDSGPADGAITAPDIAIIVRQFGHTCVLPPN